MQPDELRTLRDLIYGGTSDAPNGHSLEAAIDQLLDAYEEADKYDATPSTEQWDYAHEDFQYCLARVLNVGVALVGRDGDLEDENGNVLADLPYAATSADASADVPSDPGGGS